MGRDTLANASAFLQSNVVKAFTGYFRLKDFIHAVRACKTLAEERTLVARESAAIRSSFKEDVSFDLLYHAICKLLFIHMMGYPAHFGQVESLKMAAHASMRDKRLGYLGSTQLLDETQPTLTLITNSLKGDLNHSSNSVIALALTNLALTASPDIARDLADEVERLLHSPVAYLRKKAALCAARLVARVPDLAELFEGRLTALLGDRDHGVVIGGLGLMLQLCRNDVMYVIQFRKSLLPMLIRQLQTLIVGSGKEGGVRYGGASEYEISGISDPFLQVRLLQLLRILGEGDVEASDAMTDTLTQLATTTDPSKNVGHAVLYEAAVTIMNIESDGALRTMAINILGRLLSSSSSDHNLRYVALTLLNRITISSMIPSSSTGSEAMEERIAAVQRHRSTILDCLHDPDTSIRNRAVDLSLSLASRETIRAVTAELLDVLPIIKGVDELAFKQSLVTRLAVAIAQFAPSPTWYVDQMIKLLSHLDDVHSLGLGVAGLLLVEGSGEGETTGNRKDRIVSTFVRIIGNTLSLHQYAPQKLYSTVVLSGLSSSQSPSSSSSNQPNSKEQLYLSEALIQATVWAMGEFADKLMAGRATAKGIVQTLAEWAQLSHHRSHEFIGYVINALGKLSHRVASPSTSLIEMLRNALEAIAKDYINQHDLHYRAKEMAAIVGDPTLRSIFLVRLPPDTAGDRLGRVSAMTVKLSGSRLSSAGIQSPREEKLVDEEGDATSLNSPSVRPDLGTGDVFAELASLSLDSPSKAMEDLEMAVYYNDELVVRATITAQNAEMGIVDIRLGIKNHSEEHMKEVFLQCAVPKSMKLSMFPASSDHIYPRDSLEQLLQIKVADLQTTKLKLRVKLSYTLSSLGPREVQFDVTRFDHPNPT